jgi:hypothetical protein
MMNAILAATAAATGTWTDRPAAFDRLLASGISRPSPA